MAFERGKIRFERLSIDVQYHAAYNFLNLKGVLAERWAHGPYFGAMLDQGLQVNLTPGDEQQDKGLQAYYGLKGAGFNAEGRRDEKETPRIALSWVSDAVEVLKPKRFVSVVTRLFVVYPIKNPDQASRRLRDRFYNQQEASRLIPSRFDSYHSAYNALVIKGDLNGGIILGVVGPPHRGQFFQIPDSERDGHWWMGLQIAYGRNNQDGIEQPVEAARSLVTDALADYRQIVTAAFPTLVA